MSIIIRKNKHTARIMRQVYVRKGVEGNEYGFVRQVPLATISLSAPDIPAHIADLLTSKEREHLERKVIAPARLAAERLRKEADAREADPIWRVQEALRWLREAATRCHQNPLSAALRDELSSTVAKLTALSAGKLVDGDPIDAVVEAARDAISHVEKGFYGRNDGPIRKDALASKKWTELRSVLLDDKGSLLAALQDMGWVVRRGAGSK